MDERIINRVVRTAVTFENSKPHEILALIEHYSKGEAFFDNEHVKPLTDELFHAARELNMSVAELRSAVVESLGPKTPALSFDETEWPWARSLALSFISQQSKFLLCCRYGLFNANARSVIYQEQGLIAQPHKWIRELRQFSNHRGYQITWAFKRFQDLQEKHKDDALWAWICEQNGYRGGKIEHTSEMFEVAKLADGFKARITTFEKKRLESVVAGDYVA